MLKDVELWPLKRFGDSPLRLDWFGHVTRSSRNGIVVPYVTVVHSNQCNGSEGAPR